MVRSPEALRALIEPALSSSGLELWDVELAGDVVRVLVDRPGGIDLDSLATTAGRVVSPLLDEHPELTPEGRFQLEVSSPGVERTLRTVEHYRRYIGGEVSVKTRVAVDGARRHHGRLVDADDEAVTVAPDDAPAGTVVRLPHDQIERARTVLVWGPARSKGPQSKGARAQAPKPAVKRPAAGGRVTATSPVASNDAKDSEP